MLNLSFKEFLIHEAPAPPPGGGALGGIGGGLGGPPLSTGGPGAGPGGPGAGLGGPPPMGGGLGGIGGGLGGPPIGGGLGGPQDANSQVPAKEIKATNIWEILDQILSSKGHTKVDNTSNEAPPEPKPKTYKSLKV